MPLYIAIMPLITGYRTTSSLIAGTTSPIMPLTTYTTNSYNTAY